MLVRTSLRALPVTLICIVPMGSDPPVTESGPVWATASSGGSGECEGSSAGVADKAWSMVCLRLRQGQVQEILRLSSTDGADYGALYQRVGSFVGQDQVVWLPLAGARGSFLKRWRGVFPWHRQWDFQQMARHALPDWTTHPLARLARHFGVEAQDLRNPEALGILAALVLDHLLGTLEKTGLKTPEQCQHFCGPKSRRSRWTRRDWPFQWQRLRSYPTQPGVYFMKNRAGEILYIGKAKNLKKRLSSYFQKPSALPPKIAVLMRQVVHIEVTVVGSELEALLLEAQFIKQHQPFFNQKIKDYQRMVFLGLTVADPFPRLMVCEEASHPELAYVGPFYAVNALKDRMLTINHLFGLRDCTDSKFQAHRQTPCVQYQLGLCSGPCAGKISLSQYQARVEDFLRLLRQQPCHAVEALLAKREAYVEALRFEQAAQVQAQLEQVARLSKASERLVEAVEQRHCLLVLPHSQTGCFRVLAVIGGQPQEWRTLNPDHLAIDDWLPWIEGLQGQIAQRLAQDGMASGLAIPKASYEEVRLIDQWCRQQSGEAAQPQIPMERVSAMAVWERLQALVGLGDPVMEAFNDYEASLAQVEEAWAWEQGLA